MANLTIEQIKKIGQEKLGREITDEEAKRYIEGGELSDDELMAVSGGGCGEESNRTKDPHPDGVCEHFEPRNSYSSRKCGDCVYCMKSGKMPAMCMYRG